MNQPKDSMFNRLLRKLSAIEPNEQKATFASASFVFILMASYFILRPVRDAMASDWSDSEVSLLWNINFFVSVAIVAIYGFTVSRVRFRHIVPVMYGFFALTFIAFFFGTSMTNDRVLLDKIFYVWVSVFALFHLSVFWTFMADTFNKEQATRLFAIIGSGASAGALFGPAMPALFATQLGTDTLMLIASLGLLAVIPLVFYIYHLKNTDLGNHGLVAESPQDKLGGNWWHGFASLMSNRNLFGIAIFIVLYVFIATFVYFEQKNLLSAYSRAERTEILGSIDWIVNMVTFGLAFFATSRIVNKLGMPIALALMPILVCIGLLILAFAPLLVVLLALQVVRRGGNYSLTRPAREMLFTQVSAEDRFKTKPVIDIVVYRGGDTVSSILFAVLTDGIGLGLAAVAAVGAGIAALWAWVGIKLGQNFNMNETSTSTPSVPKL